MGKQKDEKREMAHSRKRPKRTPKEEAEYTKKMKEIYRKLGGASLLWVPTEEELE